MSDISKPSDVPTWATDGDKLQPPAGKQAQGFVPRERATAQHFNWLFHSIGNWMKWLNSMFGQSISSVPGARYLAVASNNIAEPRGIELQGHVTHGTCCNEVQWSDGRLEGSDKRVAALSVFGEYGHPELLVFAKDPDTEGLGEERVSISPWRTIVRNSAQFDRDLALKSLVLKDAVYGAAALAGRDSSPDFVIELPAGGGVLDVDNRSWVGVLAHDAHATVTGLSGFEVGQLVICEFVGASGVALESVTLRHDDSNYGPDTFRLRGRQDLEIQMGGVGDHIVCVFLCGFQQSRVLAVNL